MSDTVECSRCGRTAAALTGPAPLSAKLAAKVRDNVCADCWREWQGMEVMVINELQLNFMDPKAQDVLNDHMREFFGLGAAGRAQDPHLPTKEEHEAEGRSTVAPEDD
jgi:Fe-S cluster biosynthesis and repair protein YggX